MSAMTDTTYDFRSILGRVPTAVAVITTMQDEGPVGVAVGSFSSVSLDPPMVGFYIGRSSTSWPFIEATGRFCANILSSRQQRVSRQFATSGADKFAGIRFETTAAGNPVLDGVTAWIDCEIDHIADAGDHYLVLGRIVEMDAPNAADALVFLGGSYGQVTTL